MLLFLLLLLTLLAVDLYENGFAAGGVCDFGFGKRLRSVQEVAVRGFFLEKLPASIVIESVNCSGLVDFTMAATFHVSQGEAKQLVADLEATFLSQQRHPIVGDSQKRRRMVGTPALTTYSYFLPGLPPFDLRTVSVSIPMNSKVAATVVFDGGTY